MEVWKREIQIDPKHVVDRAHHILKADLAVNRAFGSGVRFPDHLPHFQTAAIEQGTTGVGPVFAARTGVD